MLVKPWPTMRPVDFLSSTTEPITGEPTTSPDFNTSTVSPPDDESASTPSWLPYAIAGTAFVAILILLLFCCCKAVRDMFICCCLVRKGNQLVTPSAAPIDSKYTSNYRPSKISGIISTSNGSQSSKMKPGSRISSAARSGTINTYSPSLKTSYLPSKQQLASSAKTQKYIGTILTSGRKSRPPLVSARPSMSSSKAPSAALQIANTQKIIGNILTHDGSSRRRSKQIVQRNSVK